MTVKMVLQSAAPSNDNFDKTSLRQCARGDNYFAKDYIIYIIINNKFETLVFFLIIFIKSG